MSNSIERVDAPSGATHKTLKGTYMKHAAGAWFEWLHEWVKVDSGVHVNVNQLTEISGDEMNLKKLTQAVFEGLPPEYRWAAVDADGDIVIADHEHFFWHERKKWLFPSDKTIKIIVKTSGYDTTDWQNSLIERQNVLTAADIDWSKAPAGATHWHDGEWIRWTGHKDMNLWNLDAWDDGCRWTESAYGWHGTLETFLEDGAIPRPESITDVARSIEAARVAEQFKVEPCPYGCVAATIERACMPWPDGDPRHFETSDVQETKKYPHYFKDVSDVDAIDLYHVARLYDITDPALFHAFKKIACAGKRGAKDQAQDVEEAIDALQRWQELNV